jgi:DNA-binding MarR family transcriptional regulator
VQATVAPRATPKQLAKALLALWARIGRGHEGETFRLFEELGLTVTQMKTLQVLSQCTEELSVKELSDKLKLSLPSASRTTDALLRRGWVERREDEHDRRMKRVRITPEGRSIAERIASARLAGLEDFAASLTDEQRLALHTAISDLI